MLVTLAKNEDVNAVLLGGQAVIEGVMMRGPAMIATAVRRADGSIVVHKEPFAPLSKRYPVLALPILRGAVGLVEMMGIGMKSLNFSAEESMKDIEPEKHQDGATAGKKQSGAALWGTVAVSLVIAVGVFFVLPLFLASTFFEASQEPLRFNLLAGFVRMTLFLGYLFAISRIPDIKRLFMYHGAEHKTVFMYESEKSLDPGRAVRYSRFHPRCGTSFLLIVMIASILLFSVMDTLMLLVVDRLTLPIRLSTHLLALPFVGGASYEVIRLAARYSSTLIGKAAIQPGLWLQRVTTREPDAAQLEIAAVALSAALGNDGAPNA
jgi:uncharacterized protein YqhQ